MQQANSQLFLQPLQTLAGDGDRQIQATGGGGNRAQVDYAQEQGQITDSIHYQYFIESD